MLFCIITAFFEFFFFFFNDTATTEIYTLSLHDALPIWHLARQDQGQGRRIVGRVAGLEFVAQHGMVLVQAAAHADQLADRKSTRLNSSHLVISYAVFCLKKKKKIFSINFSEPLTVCSHP